jgi:hypothetical protein
VVVGQGKALGLAVRNDQSRKRYSGLLSSLKEAVRPRKCLKIPTWGVNTST